MARRNDAVALLTAAGASTRMGSPKALVAWPPGSTATLLEHQLRALAGFARIVVVTGAHRLPPGALANAPNAVEVHHPGWAEGRSSSLEAGALALPDGASAIIVAAIDQPLEADLVDHLLEALADANAIQPATRRDGEGSELPLRRGHPVVLAGRLLGPLRQASQYPDGLRGLLAAHPGTLLPVDSPAIHLDLNTPADVA